MPKHEPSFEERQPNLHDVIKFDLIADAEEHGTDPNTTELQSRLEDLNTGAKVVNNLSAPRWRRIIHKIIIGPENE